MPDSLRWGATGETGLFIVAGFFFNSDKAYLLRSTEARVDVASIDRDAINQKYAKSC